MARELCQEREPLFGREKRHSGRMDAQANDHLVEEPGGALDEIEMPLRWRVEATREHGDAGGHRYFAPGAFGVGVAGEGAPFGGTSGGTTGLAEPGGEAGAPGPGAPEPAGGGAPPGSGMPCAAA